MANSIEYFPFNIDFFNDDKVALIEAEYGAIGSCIAIRLLCKIYHSGYYYQWGKDECLLFARQAGIRHEELQTIVDALVSRSFFDADLYKRYNILTSHGIQQRYFDIVKRRQKILVKEEYLLIDINKYGNLITIRGEVEKVEQPEEQPALDTLNNEVMEMKASEIWLESVAMRFNITIADIKGYLDIFAVDCRSRANTHHDSIGDAQRHFCDWLRIQLDIKNKDNERKQTHDRRRSNKATPVTNEVFTTTF